MLTLLWGSYLHFFLKRWELSRQMGEKTNPSPRSQACWCQCFCHPVPDVVKGQKMKVHVLYPTCQHSPSRHCTGTLGTGKGKAIPHQCFPRGTHPKDVWFGLQAICCIQFILSRSLANYTYLVYVWGGGAKQTLNKKFKSRRHLPSGLMEKINLSGLN